MIKYKQYRIRIKIIYKISNKKLILLIEIIVHNVGLLWQKFVAYVKKRNVYISALCVKNRSKYI